MNSVFVDFNELLHPHCCGFFLLDVNSYPHCSVCQTGNYIISVRLYSLNIYKLFKYILIFKNEFSTNNFIH